MASARTKGLQHPELIFQRLPIDIIKTAPGAQSEHLQAVIILDWVKVGVEWNASLDRRALVPFRNVLNYK